MLGEPEEKNKRFRYRPIRDRDFNPRKLKYDALVRDTQTEDYSFNIRGIRIPRQSKTSSGRNMVPGCLAVVVSYDPYDNILVQIKK